MVIFILGIVLGVLIGVIITLNISKNKKIDKKIDKKSDIEIIGYIDGYATKLFESDHREDGYANIEGCKSYINSKFQRMRVELGIDVNIYDEIYAYCDAGWVRVYKKKKEKNDTIEE